MTLENNVVMLIFGTRCLKGSHCNHWFKWRDNGSDKFEISFSQAQKSNEIKRRRPYKSGAVVIPDGLGVAESLQDGVGLDHLVLERGFPGRSFSGGADRRKVTDHLLGVFGLSGTGLTATCIENHLSIRC